MRYFQPNINNYSDLLMENVIAVFFIYYDLIYKWFPFKNSDNSLKHRAEEFIRHNYEDLYNDIRKERRNRAINYILDRKRWWLIILIVGNAFFLLPLINIETLNIINLKYKTAETIIDQRTSNLAAIISMTLVVVGFLINNLAVKESFAYKILFKNSNFYPIIYFTLSTICCFIILSTLRESLPNSDYFIRSVLVGTYLSLLILIFIGILFIRIITFTNNKEIKKIYSNELMKESKYFFTK